MACAVRTLVPDPPTRGFHAVLGARRRCGADRRDEVWEGVPHMALTCMAEFNLGEPDDYRIPEGGLLACPLEVYHPTAVLALEILSPGDESRDKLSFYAAHHVDEVLIVDPEQLAERISWPA